MRIGNDYFFSAKHLDVIDVIDWSELYLFTGCNSVAIDECARFRRDVFHDPYLSHRLNGFP